MHHSILLILFLLSIVKLSFAAAPSSPNTIDDPDAQRLSNTRLQCGCRFVKNRIKAITLDYIPPPTSNNNLLLLNLVQHKRTTEKKTEEPPSIADKAPDRLECGCHTVKLNIKTRTMIDPKPPQ